MLQCVSSKFSFRNEKNKNKTKKQGVVLKLNDYESGFITQSNS